MKESVLALLFLAAGAAMAGTDVAVSSSSGVRYIPGDVVQGIKDRVVRFHTANPLVQERLITENVEAYFALQNVPNSPAKRKAAQDFPFQYAKQLYLAQRPSLRGL